MIVGPPSPSLSGVPLRSGHQRGIRGRWWFGLPRGDHPGEGHVEQVRIGQHHGPELIPGHRVGSRRDHDGHTVAGWRSSRAPGGRSSAVAEITREPPGADTADCSSEATVILRGLALSATGIVSRNTPPW